MVQVIYRNRRSIAQAIKPADFESTQDWVIRKRYLWCHLTNGDTPWAVRSYYLENIDNPRNRDPQIVKGARVKAIHDTLHAQTNYDRLVRAGLFHQPYEVFRGCIEPFYLLISRLFPEFREAAAYELVRHLRDYHRAQKRLTTCVI